MILAAGRGERMRPLTDTTPKPMLRAGGKPLIVWLIEALARAGVRDLVINHAHLGAVLEAGLGTGDAFGVRIAYSPESEALETAGGIANALPLLGDAPFIVANGDVFTTLGFDGVAAMARSLAPDTLAHLLLVPNPEHNPAGDFALAGDRVTSEETGRLTFSGIAVYRPGLFDGVARGARARLAPILREAIAAGAVTGERLAGDWIDVGTPARLAALDRALGMGGRPLATERLTPR